MFGQVCHDVCVCLCYPVSGWSPSAESGNPAATAHSLASLQMLASAPPVTPAERLCISQSFLRKTIRPPVPLALVSTVSNHLTQLHLSALLLNRTCGR